VAFASKVGKAATRLELHHGSTAGNLHDFHQFVGASAQMTWSAPVGSLKGGRTKGKGKGKGQPRQEQGKGQGSLGTKPPWQQGNSRQDDKWNKQLQDMERRLQSRDQQLQALIKKWNPTQATAPPPPRGRVSEVIPRDTPANASPNKTLMYTSKGTQVEVAWTCSCGQQHWSAKLRACVGCKLPSTAWTKVPPQPAKKDVPKPFRDNKTLSWFQQMGFLTDQEANEEEGEVMDVEEDDLNAKRSKAAKILQDLQSCQADPELLRMAQAQLDAFPAPQQPKASQESWDMYKLHRIQAQMMDSHNAQKIAQQSVLEELQTQAATLQSKVEAQLATILDEQMQFDKYHQAVQSAMALKQAGGPPASDAQPAAQNPTPTQVTSSVLANQLRKAESSQAQMEAQALVFGVEADTLMKIMRYAYSGAITGSAADEHVAGPAAPATSAASASAASTPVPPDPVL
jgi:hypothetical protein